MQTYFTEAFMKGWFGIFIGAVIIILMLPFTFTGIDEARQATYAQTVPSIGAETDVDVVLLKPLYNDDLVNVITITSDNSEDVPAVNSYTTGSKMLNIIGLSGSDTRNLIVTYGYARLAGAQDTFMGNLPLFLIIGLVIMVALGLWQGRGR